MGKEWDSKIFHHSRFKYRFRLHGLPEPRVLTGILPVPKFGSFKIALLRTDQGG